MIRRWRWRSGIAAALALGSSPAVAFDAGEVGGEPVSIDVTESSSVIYNTDNRDSQPNQVATRANDDWGLWHNRLNLQARRGRWRLALRLDTAWFYTSPQPASIASDLVEGRPPGPETDALERTKLLEAGADRADLFVATMKGGQS